MDKRIVIIDGNSLINRAYYAMQKPMITREGLYTQGVYGFINMLSKIKKEYPSGYIAVAFDLKGPTFRHKEYDQYKAGRKPMPPELAMQMPLLKETLSAMNIAMIEKEGFEADDIIGTLSLKAEKEGFEVLIITGDRDELQLAGEKTRVLITKKGVSNFELYDEKAMYEKYGFGPKEFIDYKGLMGDQSDNIPGVPGVGEKTASKLILQFGSIENLLENTDKITSKSLRTKIEENAKLAVMSKRLATIDRHMAIDEDMDSLKWEEPDTDRLTDVYKKLEFNSFLKRMSKEFGPGKEDRPGEKTDNEEETSIDGRKIDVKEVERVSFDSVEDIDVIGSGTPVTIKVIGDNSHQKPPAIFGAGIMWENKFAYIDFSDRDAVRFAKSAQDWKISGHDLKKDIYMLMCHGMEDAHVEFDTAVAQYVLDSGRSNYDMSAMAQEYFHETIKSEKEFMADTMQMDMLGQASEEGERYALRSCLLAEGIKAVQKKELIAKKAESICYDLEFPLIKVMAHMEHAGFAVDREQLKRQGEAIKEEIERLTAEIHSLAGEEFNINSPQQLGSVLFEKLGLTAGKKTKKGYSTSAEILEKIKDEHPIVALVLRYRTLTKINGTYIDGLLPLIGDDGRIHAHFNQTVTATGRISGSDPNLQNIPIRYEQGRQLRKAFVPRDGYVLIGADYSQIELRVLAHMSEDPALIDSFNAGEDIHRATAAKVLGVAENEITAEQRSRAKAVNFGVIYGMSSFGLSTELHIGRKEAEKYIQDYFEKHPRVKEFMDGQIEMCKEQGYVETIMGRRRYINEIKASSYPVRQMGERLAMNSPIQGSAADIIKVAMVKVHEALKPYKSRLILQVHDELIVETALDETAQVEKILKENMEKAVELKVSTTVELNRGDSWYDLK